jgi:hypothetical protein
MKNKITIGESRAPGKIISVGESRATKNNTSRGGDRALEKVISKDARILPQEAGLEPLKKNMQTMILGLSRIKPQ